MADSTVPRLCMCHGIQSMRRLRLESIGASPLMNETGKRATFVFVWVTVTFSKGAQEYESGYGRGVVLSSGKIAGGTSKICTKWRTSFRFSNMKRGMGLKSLVDLLSP